MSAVGEGVAPPGPVLVTGATGFLGREIVQQLVQRGAQVHVFARAGSDRGPLARLPLVWHAGDLRDPESVKRAVRAFAEASRARRHPGFIVHSAALISYKSRDRELARVVNVDGTRSFLDAAIEAGVARFVFISSVVTVGHSTDGEPIDERAPFNNGGFGVDYVDTKRAAEDLVIAAARSLDVVVVNPAAIFGPVERDSNTVRFIRSVADGKAPRFAPPGSIGVVSVRDAATGVLLALERGRRGERYLLVESTVSALELFQRIARELGARPASWRCPRWLWPTVLVAARIVDRIRPIEVAPPQGLRMLGLELRFDASKARTELGWRPAGFDRVLAETVAHVRAHAS
jgi:dihydroflavonol-4-reductase